MVQTATSAAVKMSHFWTRPLLTKNISNSPEPHISPLLPVAEIIPFGQSVAAEIKRSANSSLTHDLNLTSYLSETVKFCCSTGIVFP